MTTLLRWLLFILLLLQIGIQTLVIRVWGCGWVGGWVLEPFWIVFCTLSLVVSPIVLDLLCFSIPASLFLTHSFTISVSLSLSLSLPLCLSRSF